MGKIDSDGTVLIAGYFFKHSTKNNIKKGENISRSKIRQLLLRNQQRKFFSSSRKTFCTNFIIHFFTKTVNETVYCSS